MFKLCSDAKSITASWACGYTLIVSISTIAFQNAAAKTQCHCQNTTAHYFMKHSINHATKTVLFWTKYLRTTTPKSDISDSFQIYNSLLTLIAQHLISIGRILPNLSNVTILKRFLRICISQSKYCLVFSRPAADYPHIRPSATSLFINPYPRLILALFVYTFHLLQG